MAREILTSSDDSVVVVKDLQVLFQEKGVGITPLWNAIESLGEQMKESIVGDRVMGKASALLCLYAGVQRVYACQISKSALAVLLQAEIPGETDKIIPYVTDKQGTGLCPFEQLLERVTDPNEAYELIQQKLASMQK